MLACGEWWALEEMLLIHAIDTKLYKWQESFLSDSISEWSWFLKFWIALQTPGVGAKTSVLTCVSKASCVRVYLDLLLFSLLQSLDT